MQCQSSIPEAMSIKSKQFKGDCACCKGIYAAANTNASNFLLAREGVGNESVKSSQTNEKQYGMLNIQCTDIGIHHKVHIQWVYRMSVGCNASNCKNTVFASQP